VRLLYIMDKEKQSMPARTASELVEGAEGWEDHIQLLPVHSLPHPVLINGESKRGVYALEDLMRMQARAEGGPIASPLTRREVNLYAPDALVAVRWGDDAAARAKASATEAHMRAMGLRPSERLLAAHDVTRRRAPIVLWAWLSQLYADWQKNLLSDAVPIAPAAYAEHPIEMAHQGSELSGCARAELTLRHLEGDVVLFKTRGGTSHIRAVVRWGLALIEAHINARVDAALRSGSVATALAWIKLSKLELPHAVHALARWAASHPDSASDIRAELRAHAERYFQSRLDYLTSHFLEFDHASSPAEQRARRESARHLLEHVIKPFTRSAYATPAMASQWRALVTAEHARLRQRG
jgi:hypothetical protein